MGKLETLLLAGRLFSGGNGGIVLAAPTLSLSGDTLTVTPGNNGAFCDGYYLRSGDSTIAVLTETTVDLRALELTAGQRYSLTARAFGTGAGTSEDSNAVTWVNKPDPTVTLSAESLSLLAGQSGTLTVTADSDGTVTAQSSDPLAATVSVSGSTVTVTGVSAGSAVISVSVAEGSEHRAAATLTAAITVTGVYVEFTSAAAFSMAATQNWDGTVYASTDGSTWTAWDGSSISVGSGGDGYRLRFRGSGNSIITTSASTVPWEITGSGVRVSGLLEALLDYEAVENGQNPVMGVKAFYFWLKNCSALNSAAGLRLHRSSLTEGCYQGMFSTCTALTDTPAFSQATLQKSCYQAMFLNCTALTVPPVLPAATLADSCYRAMFSGCSALTAAPALPALTGEANCYYSMFANCTALTTAPTIGATSLGLCSCRQMFEGCVGLTAAPALPAVTLAKESYNGMFKNCTRLRSLPKLPATVLGQSSYMNMFSGCSAIRVMSASADIFVYPWRVPQSGSINTESAAGWNQNMLSGTGGSVTGDPTAGTTYYTDYAPVG